MVPPAPPHIYLLGRYNIALKKSISGVPSVNAVVKTPVPIFVHRQSAGPVQPRPCVGLSTRYRIARPGQCGAVTLGRGAGLAVLGATPDPRGAIQPSPPPNASPSLWAAQSHQNSQHMMPSSIDPLPATHRLGISIPSHLTPTAPVALAPIIPHGVSAFPGCRPGACHVVQCTELDRQSDRGPGAGADPRRHRDGHWLR